MRALPAFHTSHEQDSLAAGDRPEVAVELVDAPKRRVVKVLRARQAGGTGRPFFAMASQRFLRRLCLTAHSFTILS